MGLSFLAKERLEPWEVIREAKNGISPGATRWNKSFRTDSRVLDPELKENEFLLFEVIQIVVIH